MRADELMDQMDQQAREYEVSLRRVEEDLARASSAEAAIAVRIAHTLSKLGSVRLKQRDNIIACAAPLLATRDAEERAARAALQNTEESIAQIMGQLRQAQAELARREAMVHERLQRDPAAVAALNERAAARGAWEAYEVFAQDLREECERKLLGFEGNPLYQYLIGRRFDEADYAAATPIVRALDSWIARLCKFAVNRKNHLTLIGMRAVLARQREGYLQRLARADKILDPMTAAAAREVGADEARADYDAKERQLQSAKGRAGEIQDALTAYADRTDPAYAAVLDLVSQELGTRTIDELVAQACTTASVEDDELVAQLADLYEQRRHLQEEQVKLHTQRAEAAQQYQRAKQLVRQLCREGRLADRGRYDTGVDWQGMFLSYVAGGMSVQAVSAELSRHYQRQADDDSGTMNVGSFASNVLGGGDSGAADFGGGDYSTSDSF